MAVFGIEIVELHDRALAEWCRRDEEQGSAALPSLADASTAFGARSDMGGGEGLRALVLSEHFANLCIWRLEDQARRRDVGDQVIAGVKRAIDPWNQRRNDLMEQIDEEVLSRFVAVDIGNAEQHSETAAMMLDRLSVMALKIRNMDAAARAAGEDAALAEQCRAKSAILREQRADLAACLERLLADFAAGRRHFKMYRQMKAYNDPNLNPVLRTRR